MRETPITDLMLNSLVFSRKLFGLGRGITIKFSDFLFSNCPMIKVD